MTAGNNNRALLTALLRNGGRWRGAPVRPSALTGEGNVHVDAGLTDEPDDVESSVGEDRSVGLIQVVV